MSTLPPVESGRHLRAFIYLRMRAAMLAVARFPQRKFFYLFLFIPQDEPYLAGSQQPDRQDELAARS